MVHLYHVPHGSPEVCVRVHGEHHYGRVAAAFLTWPAAGFLLVDVFRDRLRGRRRRLCRWLCLVGARCGRRPCWRRRWKAWFSVVVDVEGSEVVKEEAVDVGERRRLVVVLAAPVTGGGRGSGGVIAVHVHRRGSREPAGGEEARAGDVGWNNCRAGDVHWRDLLERPADVELQGSVQLGSLPLIFHFLSLSQAVHIAWQQIWE